MSIKFPILHFATKSTYELKVVEAPPWDKLVLIPKPNKKKKRIDKHVVQSFFLTHHVSLETLYAWLPGPNPVPIPVLAPNGLLRLNPEVWPKLKVLVPPNGGGLAPNPPVLVPVI